MIKMKLMFFIVTFCLFVLPTQQTRADDVYYYYWKEKIFLKESPDKIFLKIDTKKADRESLQRMVSHYCSDDLEVNKDGKVLPFVFLETKNGENFPSDLLDSFIADSTIISATSVLQYNNVFQGLTDEFIVKLNNSSFYEQFEKLVLTNRCKIVAENFYGDNHFLLSVPKKSKFNSLEMANLFYETGLFEYATPDFVVQNAFHSNDTYFNDQWGLKNTGQYSGTTGIDIKAEAAWTITKGISNIKIAIIDTGTELNHPDLASNLLPGYDSSGNNSGGAPVLPSENHGTACSGIIGAINNNGIGISGVAPSCKMIPIHASNGTSLPNSYLLDAFRWACNNANADVISNSWGGGSPFAPLTSLIDSVAIHGRNGLGCVVVFSTGNYNTSVSYPATLSNVIAVGAISPCGQRKSPSSCDTETSWGSNYGQELDVVAPGVLISTTDRIGIMGYNPNTPIHPLCGGTILDNDYSNRDYTVWFNGTSAACPHVSGVAALVLSANPYLTGQQVRNIIESTAQKVRPDLYTYSTYSTHPNGTWNSEMGYGLVDAYAAAQTACSNIAFEYKVVSTYTAIRGCGDVYLHSVNVPNNGQLIVEVPGTVSIEGPFYIGGSSLFSVY